MLHGLITTFTFEDFKRLLHEEKYNELIYNCYYCSNKTDIILFLEKHLHLNNLIINYVYIRNNYKIGNFSNKDILTKCLILAYKTIYIIVCHISLCIDINIHFDILNIILRKFEEKFRGYVDGHIIEYAMNQSNKEMLQFIDAMSQNITYPNENKIYLDLPNPELVSNIIEGRWSYPSLYYIENKRCIKFIKNYSGRCQKYYESYQYVSEKLKKVFDNYLEYKVFEVSKYFDNNIFN